MSENAAEKTPDAPDAEAPVAEKPLAESLPGAKPMAANDAPSAAERGAAFETLLGDVPLQVTVELGRIRLPLREVGRRLGPGSIIPLSKLTGESLDIRVNDRLVARAEAIAIGDRYGVRIVEIVSGDAQ